MCPLRGHRRRREGGSKHSASVGAAMSAGASPMSPRAEHTLGNRPSGPQRAGPGQERCGGGGPQEGARLQGGGEARGRMCLSGREVASAGGSGPRESSLQHLRRVLAWAQGHRACGLCSIMARTLACHQAARHDSPLCSPAHVHSWDWTSCPRWPVAGRQDETVPGPPGQWGDTRTAPETRVSMPGGPRRQFSRGPAPAASPRGLWGHILPLRLPLTRGTPSSVCLGFLHCRVRCLVMPPHGVRVTRAEQGTGCRPDGVRGRVGHTLRGHGELVCAREQWGPRGRYEPQTLALPSSALLAPSPGGQWPARDTRALLGTEPGLGWAPRSLSPAFLA